MTWNLGKSKPIYKQLKEHVELDIATQKYAPSDKLPSVRELALEAGVNPNTMQRALSLLEEKGLVFSERTTGRFITDDADIISNLHKQLAAEYTDSYIVQMKSLGYTDEEILSTIKNYKNKINAEATEEETNEQSIGM